MTNIETSARFLLQAVLAEIEVFAALPDDLEVTGDRFVASMVGKGVPFQPAFWVGESLSSARRKTFSRAARRLADRGLIRRITDRGRDRVRYLVPTLKGLRQAIVLTNGKADPIAVREGLGRTCWGRDLAKKLR